MRREITVKIVPPQKKMKKNALFHRRQVGSSFMNVMGMDGVKTPYKHQQFCVPPQTTTGPTIIAFFTRQTIKIILVNRRLQRL